MIAALRKLMGGADHTQAAASRRQKEAESRRTLHEAATSVHFLEVSAELMARRRELRLAQEASANGNGHADEEPGE